MPWPFKNHCGLRYGALVVQQHAGKRNNGHQWLCVCDCGQKTVVAACHLVSGHTQSCGCRLVQKSRPAKTRTPEFWVWCGMKSRCKSKDSAYGGRGIKVCERWQKSFENFIADMGTRPSPKHTIERVDVNGDYEPSNCKWIPKSEQSENTTRTHWVYFQGEKMSIAKACRISGVNYWNVMYHINKSKKEPQEALERFIGKQA